MHRGKSLPGNSLCSGGVFLPQRLIAWFGYRRDRNLW